MNANSNPQWGSSYRLIASEKWKAKSAAMGRNVTEALVEYARPKPGMKVLDLASGTGEPGISLAARVGSEGHVTALDLSGDLLEIATKRAQQRGLTNFLTQQADAHELPFPDQSFDLVTSRFGVMFFKDCEKALGEVHRVLKPEARACFLAWGPFEQPYWSSTMGIVARRVGGAHPCSRRTGSLQVCPARNSVVGIAEGRLQQYRRGNKVTAMDLARNSRRSLGASAGSRNAVSCFVAKSPRIQA